MIVVTWWECFLKEIEEIFSVFLLSFRNVRKSRRKNCLLLLFLFSQTSTFCVLSLYPFIAKGNSFKKKTFLSAAFLCFLQGLPITQSKKLFKLNYMYWWQIDFKTVASWYIVNKRSLEEKRHLMQGLYGWFALVRKHKTTYADAVRCW